MKKITVPFGIMIIILAVSCATHRVPTQPGASQSPTVTCTATETPDVTATNSPAVTPTLSGTITATSTNTPLLLATATCTATVEQIGIIITMQRVENSGLLGEQYSVSVMDTAGATLTTAAVSMIGPNGLIGVPAANGLFVFSAMGSASNYVFDAQYAVSVTYNAVNYYGTFMSEGDVTIAADGSTVSWPFAADAAMVALYTPSMSMQMFGPGLTSPFDVNATGIYGNGPGMYMIAPMITDTLPVIFTGPAVTGIAALQNLKMVQVVKP